MSPPAVVWIVVGLVGMVAVLLLLVGLVLQVMSLGRVLRRFRDEVQPVAEEISAGSGRASERLADLPSAGRSGRP